MTTSSYGPNVAKVIITESHVIQPGYHLASGFITQESTDLVRRTIALPYMTKHPASKKNTLHKMFFAEAAKAWSALTSPEKYVYSQLWRLPPELHHSPKSTEKFLEGHDLFTSDFIKAKKSGTPPPGHLISFNCVTRGSRYFAINDYRLVIYSRRLHCVVYNEVSNLVGQLPTILLDPTWDPITINGSRPCFWKYEWRDHSFFGPDPVYDFGSGIDLRTYCTYHPTQTPGWKGLSAQWFQHGNYTETKPPETSYIAGVCYAYRFLNAYTMEVRIYQDTSPHMGDVYTGVTFHWPGEPTADTKLWDYNNQLLPDYPHLALIPPHKYAIIDYRGPVPIVMEYRDDPWEAS